MFAGRHALRRAQGMVITGGRETTCHGPGWSVPKGELVSKLQALLHAGQLRIAASLPDAAELTRELQDFRVRFTDAGNATFNAREGAHVRSKRSDSSDRSPLNQGVELPLTNYRSLPV